jgi:hypothetical protein
MELVEIAADNGWEEEKKWVKRLREAGCDLVNGNGGGEGGKPGAFHPSRPVSEEQRRKISATLKGRVIGCSIRPWTPEEKERARLTKIGVKLPPASEERRRKAREGNIKFRQEHPYTEEQKKQIGEGVRRYWNSLSKEKQKELSANALAARMRGRREVFDA